MSRVLSCAVLMVVVVSFFVMGQSSAKSKEPKSYETGKLLDIREETERHTSYQTKKQSDGTTITTPVEEKKKIFHIAVQLGDLVYVGRYSPAWSFSKKPNWIIGDPIQVRIEGNKIYLLRNNGKELKTKIEKRIRVSEYSSGM